MISKQEFVNIIDKIKETYLFHDEVNDVYDKHSIDYFPFGMDGYLIDIIIDLLEDMFDVGGEFISWWMFDRNFGRDNPSVFTKEEDGMREWYLDTTEALYDFLAGHHKDDFNGDFDD